MLEAQSGVRLDAEIELTGGYGVKLKELLSPSKTVLGKGLYDVVLFEKSTIMVLFLSKTTAPDSFFKNKKAVWLLFFVPVH